MAIATTVVAGGLIMPSALRQAVSVPVLADHGGLGSCAWMLLFTDGDRRINMASAVPAFLAALSHEVWILVIPIAAVVLIVLGRTARDVQQS